MSRIGNRIINVPENVTVKEENGKVIVTGAKGTLEEKLLKGITMKQADNKITLERESEAYKANHGTMNALIMNMIKGVTEGFQKDLEIVGVGYRFNVSGNKIGINAGFSHPVEVVCPEGVEVKGISNTEIELSGIDKQKVSEFAAKIREIRSPEPYKGKGIRYKGEHVRRKEGKKAAK